MAGIVRTVDAASEPVTLAEVKNRLRADGSTTDDTDLTNLAKAARMACEQYTRRSFITQTWTLSLDRPPSQHTSSGWYPWQQGGSYVTLPYAAPLLGVTSFTSYADDDTPTVFSASNYHVDTSTNPGRVVLRLGQVWPGYQSYLRTVNGIVIVYTAGYGASSTNVPEAIRQAIIEQTRAVYDGVVGGGVICDDAKSLLAPYRVLRSLDG